MASGAKRKQGFILGMMAVLGLAALFLMFRDIPAPVAEQTVELDSADVLQ